MAIMGEMGNFTRNGGEARNGGEGGWFYNGGDEKFLKSL